MTNELKIVVKESGILTVFINDKPIGCIQQLKLTADAGSFIPSIELVLPEDIELPDNWKNGINDRIAILKQLPFVQVSRKQIKDKLDEKHDLRELGTDGVIDQF